MKIIIMAGGKQKRYAPKTPKQFINIDGERIIERSIRLFKDMGEVFVISDNPEFTYLPCNVYRTSETSHELSKFMSSNYIWNNSEEVLFIYGDCYITDDCAKRIHEEKPNKDFAFFGIHSEMIALYVHHDFYSKFIKAIDYIKELEERGEGGLCGSWTLYRLLLGKDLDKHVHYSNFVMINDESQDFDSEDCLIEWLTANPQHTGKIS